MVMARCCNCVLFMLNFLALLMSIPLILLARSFYNDPRHTTCDKYAAPDVMAAGTFLFCLSLMWMIGTLCRMKTLLWLHMCVMIVMILGTLAYSFYGLVRIRAGEGRIMPSSDGYRVEEFSSWMQREVKDKDMWLENRGCMVDFEFCKELDPWVSDLSDDSHMRNWPLQWGCCKPPSGCGYEKKNSTYWEVPKTGLAGPSANKDRDCLAYSNHQETLCFDCESCKAGYLMYMRQSLKKLFIFNICVSVFLLVVSWSSFKNLTSKGNEHYGGGYRNGMN